MVLGKNNSGKSALTRLPLLLETGIRTGSTLPLDVDALGDDPPDFLDLVYGRNVHRALRLEFAAGDLRHEVRVKATIQNIAERRTQFVSELEIDFRGRRVNLEWLGADVATYSMTVNDGPSVETHVTFRGLLPLRADHPDLPDGGRDWLQSLRFSIRQDIESTRYLSAYRQRPARLTRLPSRMAAEVGAAGENATGMLVNDHVRGDRTLLGCVNELLGDSLAGWRLEIEAQGPMYSVNLRSVADPALSVNLLDSGTGVAQVLPLLVQLAADRNATPPYRRLLHVIEEPELHLHPAFHALLADLFIGGAKRGRGRFLIETHSETMLLRLRRRIAEGRISSDDVAIHFVDHSAGSSQVRRINIDDLGNLDYWPSGVFSEDFEETKKLAEAQFARERHES